MPYHPLKSHSKVLLLNCYSTDINAVCIVLLNTNTDLQGLKLGRNCQKQAKISRNVGKIGHFQPMFSVFLQYFWPISGQLWHNSLIRSPSNNLIQTFSDRIPSWSESVEKVEKVVRWISLNIIPKFRPDSDLSDRIPTGFRPGQKRLKKYAVGEGVVL